MTNGQLQCALARALGVDDLSRVSRVVLILEPGQVPTVTVTRLLLEPETQRMTQEVAELRLRADSAGKCT